MFSHLKDTMFLIREYKLVLGFQWTEAWDGRITVHTGYKYSKYAFYVIYTYIIYTSDSAIDRVVEALFTISHILIYMDFKRQSEER